MALQWGPDSYALDAVFRPKPSSGAKIVVWAGALRSVSEGEGAAIQFANLSSPLRMLLDCLPASVLLDWTGAGPLFLTLVTPLFMSGWARFQGCWLGFAQGRSPVLNWPPPTPAIPPCRTPTPGQIPRHNKMGHLPAGWEGKIADDNPICIDHVNKPQCLTTSAHHRAHV